MDSVSSLHVSHLRSPSSVNESFSRDLYSGLVANRRVFDDLQNLSWAIINYRKLFGYVPTAAALVKSAQHFLRCVNLKHPQVLAESAETLVIHKLSSSP